MNSGRTDEEIKGNMESKGYSANREDEDGIWGRRINGGTRMRKIVRACLLCNTVAISFDARNLYSSARSLFQSFLSASNLEHLSAIPILLHKADYSLNHIEPLLLIMSDRLTRTVFFTIVIHEFEEGM